MSPPQMRSPAPLAAGGRADRTSFATRSNSRKSGATAIDFAAVNAAALAAFPAVLARILPGGKRVGSEYVALNPRREDQRRGSFQINMRTGRWSDFAVDLKGGDVISLCAYLEGINQSEAARRLAHMLGLEIGGRRHG